jgi:hypothetical protein
MQFQEFATKNLIKGKRFTLGVSLVVDDLTSVDKLFNELKAGVVEWRKKRKLSGDSIGLTVVTKEAILDDAKNYFESAILAEDNSSAFGELPISLWLIENSKLLAEVQIRGGIPKP